MKWNMPGIQQAGQAQNARRQTMAGMLKEQLMGVMVDGLRQNIAQGRAEELKAGLNRRVSDYKQLWEEFKGRNQDWETNPGSAFREFSNEQALQPGGYDVEAGNIVERNAQTYAEMDRLMGEARYQKERRAEIRAREKRQDELAEAREGRASEAHEDRREDRELAETERPTPEELAEIKRLESLERTLQGMELTSEIDFHQKYGMSRKDASYHIAASKAVGKGAKEERALAERNLASAKEKEADASKAAVATQDELDAYIADTPEENRSLNDAESRNQMRKMETAPYDFSTKVEVKDVEDALRPYGFVPGLIGGSALAEGYGFDNGKIEKDGEPLQGSEEEKAIQREEALRPVMDSSLDLIASGNPYTVPEVREARRSSFEENLLGRHHEQRSVWTPGTKDETRSRDSIIEFLKTDYGYAHRVRLASGAYNRGIEQVGGAFDTGATRSPHEMNNHAYAVWLYGMDKSEWSRHIDRLKKNEAPGPNEVPKMIPYDQLFRGTPTNAQSDRMQTLRDRRDSALSDKKAAEDEVATERARYEKMPTPEAAQANYFRERGIDLSSGRVQARAANPAAQQGQAAGQSTPPANFVTPSAAVAQARGNSKIIPKKTADMFLGDEGSNREAMIRANVWPTTKYFVKATEKNSDRFYNPTASVEIEGGGGRKVNVSAKRLYEAMVSLESTWDPNAVSSDSAVGLAQLLDDRPYEDVIEALKGENFKDGLDKWKSNPKANIRVGFLYFLKQLSDFNGDPYKAMLAYHSGPTAVRGNKRTIGPNGMDYIGLVINRLGDPAMDVK